MSNFILALLLISFSPIEALSQIDQGAQFWNLSILRGSFDSKKKIEYYLEVQPRADMTDRERSRILLRPAAIYNIDQNQSVWLGYLELTDFDFKTLERRTWQQYQRVDKIENVILLNRTRLEQRFRSGETDVGSRIRHMIRTQIPVGHENKWSIVFFDEVFLGLNENSSQPVEGFDQNRFFSGVRRDFKNKIFLESGYMNQLTTERMNHIPFFSVGKIIK